MKEVYADGIDGYYGAGLVVGDGDFCGLYE